MIITLVDDPNDFKFCAENQSNYLAFLEKTLVCTQFGTVPNSSEQVWTDLNRSEHVWTGQNRSEHVWTGLNKSGQV